MLKISDLTSCWKERLVSGKVSPIEFIKLHKVDNNLSAYKACEPQLQQNAQNFQGQNDVIFIPKSNDSVYTQFHLTKIILNMIGFSQTNVCIGPITPIP